MYNKSNLIIYQMLENDRHQSFKNGNDQRPQYFKGDNNDHLSDEQNAQRNAEFNNHFNYICGFHPQLGSKEAAKILAHKPAKDVTNEDLEREVDKYFQQEEPIEPINYLDDEA